MKAAELKELAREYATVETACDTVEIAAFVTWVSQREGVESDLGEVMNYIESGRKG